MQTPNLHLNLFAPIGVGWREDATAGELLDDNMVVLDAAVANAGTVKSVNGHVGVVVLSATDVGADASGAAATAQSNAEGYTDGKISAEVTRANAAYDASGSAATAQSNAEGYTDGKVPSTIAAALTKFLTAYDATTHTFSNGQPAYTDVSGLSTVAHTGAYGDLSGAPTIPTSFAWNVEGNATGDLTLANAGHATTFNQTSAVNWLWANTTAATAAGAISNSPILNLAGTYFTLGASAVDTWTIQDIISAPKVSATVGTCSESAGHVVTMAITNSGTAFAVGDVVTVTGMATMTWLNGLNFTLTQGGTSLQFTDGTSHAAQGNVTEAAGQVTQTNPASTLNIGQSGSNGAFVPSNTTGAGASVNINVVNSAFSLGAIPSALTFGGTKAGIGLYASGVNKFLAFNTVGNSFIFQNNGGTSYLDVTIGNGGGTNGLCQDLYAAGTATLLLRSSINTGVTAAGIGTAIGNVSTFAGLTGTQTGVQLNGPWSNSGSTIATPTFGPAYGTCAFTGTLINPVINQAAIVENIAGVQVTGGNLVTLVFADLTNTFTSGATTLTVAAVTNTTVNGSGNTIVTLVKRAAPTVVTNSSENSGSTVVLSMANTGGIVANDYVYITGLTVATWLNGKVVKVTSISANVSITFTDPTSHGTSASTPEGGGVVVSHYLTYSKTISNITLGSDTGTATQQATGAYTGLQIAVTETALGGTPNYLINCLAGAAGTTQVFAVDNLGAMYLAKAAAGAPTSAGTAGTAGQIIYYGGLLYFCSASGAAGAATWNKLNMTAV